MTKLLEVQNLQAFSSEGRTLSPIVNFELHAGEVLFLRGENGAGKSTLLKTILGLHKYFKGTFDFFPRNSEIQYLPQLGNISFHLPLTLADMLDGEVSSPLLAGLDLSKKWNTASGGERQKILFASALMKKPRVLLLDEPFNHVDKNASHLLEQSLSDYLRENPQSAMLLISHRSLNQDWPQVRYVEIR
ncbi:ATP-binding cassette domain-containing protein [Bdellovibrio svalbardensis]|uniref:ATP-binding cassette domain-containing protein n=1 Tax=Bdellovibrio svalbardensis TaxID=2972972 RepID=A0ABT6DEW2_9BACT|nr:ATP-binding cassette domain-containing protein [Bdellovibrio svalbardensis]MDG0815381.1 ATP-binding cassette domain-containing protein [Bdellovibrio svalbardensis]